MQVLHTHWILPRSPGDEAGLFIWAETAVAPQPKRDRRKTAAQLHPFLQERLHLESLARTVLSANKRVVRGQSLTLWLPTNKFGPIPSPDLLHDWQEDREAPELRQWIVEGVFLEPSGAFDLLTALNNRPIRGIRMGSDSRYWLQATNLVLEVLAQQKLRPPWSRSGIGVIYATRLAGNRSSTASRTLAVWLNWLRPCRLPPAPTR